MKKLALMFVTALCCANAYAIPIVWEVFGNNPLGNPSGTFTYDIDAGLNGTYSNIDLNGELGILDYQDFVSGNASYLTTSNVIGALLRLDFSPSLSNSGGVVKFTSLNSLDTFWGTIRHAGSGTAEGEGTPVPEPGTLLLLGAGLAAIGLLRLRKQSA